MSDESEQTERRIREKAYELWLSEGAPEGRADAHWQMAKEIVATEDGYLGTLSPATAPGAPVEPAVALENTAPTPGMADQDEEAPRVPARDPGGAGAR